MISSGSIQPRKAEIDPAINEFTIMNRLPSFTNSNFNENMRNWFDVGKAQCDRLTALWLPTIFNDKKEHDHKSVLSARPFFLGGKAFALLELAWTFFNANWTNKIRPCIEQYYSAARFGAAL